MSSSAPVKGTKALPWSSAGVAKRALWLWQVELLEEAVGRSAMSVMPASLSSWGRRFCRVPNTRSERPLASGE